jgi:hypothetical protein
METLVGTVAAIALALFAWASLFSIIPRCRTSLFRYKLWELRDQIADETRNGMFEDRARAKELVKEVERTIRWAPGMTPLSMSLARWAGKGMEFRPAHPREAIVKGLNPKDLAMFDQRLEELDRLSMRHVFLDSPSGWVYLAWAFLKALAGEVRSNRDGASGPVDLREPEHSTVLRDAKVRVSAEVQPIMYVESAEKLGNRRQGEPLSLQV